MLLEELREPIHKKQRADLHYNNHYKCKQQQHSFISSRVLCSVLIVTTTNGTQFECWQISNIFKQLSGYFSFLTTLVVLDI